MVREGIWIVRDAELCWNKAFRKAFVSELGCRFKLMFGGINKNHLSPLAVGFELAMVIEIYVIFLLILIVICSIPWIKRIKEWTPKSRCLPWSNGGKKVRRNH